MEPLEQVPLELFQEEQVPLEILQLEEVSLKLLEQVLLMMAPLESQDQVPVKTFLWSHLSRFPYISFF